MADEPDHDQRFKEVIRTFFPDFLRPFFARWAAVRCPRSHARGWPGLGGVGEDEVAETFWGLEVLRFK